MSAPAWARWLLGRLAPGSDAGDVLGDLEEAHRARVARHGRVRAHILTAGDTLDMAFALVLGRVRRRVGRRTPRAGRATLRTAHRGGPALSWLDFKLGLRMLRKYPGLTLVGGIGMAVAIAIAAGAFNVFYLWIHPRIPLDEGDRLVGIWNRDTRDNSVDRQAVHDYVVWREALTTVRDLGAYSTFSRNLIPPGGPPIPTAGAEMSASGFRTARVPPLLGRPLLPSDEHAGAPPVVVLSYPVWKERFAGDPDVVGTTARLDTTRYTVVGVMPEGFTFPAYHKVWTPLRVDSLARKPAPGPDIEVFGRLAPGATREGAQAELTALGRRLALEDPRDHEHIEPRIVSFPALEGQDLVEGGDAWQVFFAQVVLTLILCVVGANVAILVYARTAMRQGEIAVRSALGASRRRIVGQLFAEALVLASLAAVVGLLVAHLALDSLWRGITGLEGTNVAFWQRNLHLAPGTFLFTLGLVVLATLIVGVLPGLKATSRHVQRRLSRLQGAGGMSLGVTWTVLIVGQVAVAVALLPASIQESANFVDLIRADVGFPASQYLTARITGPAPVAEPLADLERSVEREPGVAGVTYGSNLPGETYGEAIEVEGTPVAPDSAQRVVVHGVSVATNYLDVFAVPLLAGRSFRQADLDSASAAVIVNESFVRDVLHGGSPLGRHVRDVTTDPAAGPRPWNEVVGVVADFPPHAWNTHHSRARIYHPSAPVRMPEIHLFVHARGVAPATLTRRVREIAGTIDPSMELHSALPLDQRYGQSEVVVLRIVALGLILMTLSVILLSAAGIYALMSFSVTRRRREIGIRTALGADRGRILADIFKHALIQLATGGAIGVCGALLLDRVMGGQLLEGHARVVLAVTLGLMTAVGATATVEPARRGLSVEPTEALRSE